MTEKPTADEIRRVGAYNRELGLKHQVEFEEKQQIAQRKAKAKYTDLKGQKVTVAEVVIEKYGKVESLVLEFENGTKLDYNYDKYDDYASINVW